ncbi:hypothetical protein OB905_09230 [Halobacteria archaeon AArc-dxtr1]|nr:hypothetical protein [Halobacteria archaeon AArc-dxtr1]
MGEVSKTTGQSVERERFTRDTVLEILSNQRRRFVIHYLKRRRTRAGRDHGGVSVGELTDQVASWENGKSVKQLTPQERKRVQNALRQFHLPKMNDCGFVEYHPKRGEIRLTDVAAQSRFYVDVLPNRGIPWGLYYVVVVGLSAVSLVGIVADVYPFTFLTTLMWSVFFVTMFGVSALWHYYDNRYRMRLGAHEKPLEVDNR